MTYSALLKWPLMFCAILISFNVAAQPPGNIVASKKTSDGRYNFLKFALNSQGQARSTSNEPEAIKRILGLGAGHNFAVDELTNKNPVFSRDEQDANHIRYKQFSKVLRLSTV